MKKMRKAKVTDVPAIRELINHFADRGDMLHRSLNQIYDNLRDYSVVEDEGNIVGCCALHVDWENLAEVKSLAVADSVQGEGWGKKLVLQCLKEARNLGIEQVYALTFVKDFFEKMGFIVVETNSLPHKVWTECINCPKYPNCDEVAMVYRGRSRRQKGA